MMTTDAHAQTNTERLITTVDNTNSILDALSALADTVASGFASVMEALGMVQADTEAIQAELGHVEGELQSISSDVAGIDGDLQSISSDVAGIGGDLTDINSNLQNVQNDLAGLSGGLTGSAAALTALGDTVQANSVAINDLSAKLDMISEAVGVVQETVVAPAMADPATMLHSGETELTVAVADFAGSVTKHPTSGVYDATNTFSCDGDVFLDTMMVSGVAEVLSTQENLEDDADEKSPVTEVSLNGVALYETYSTGDGATDFIEINEPRDFDNQFLSASSSLTIKGETDQSANNDLPTVTVTVATATDNNYLKYDGTNSTTDTPVEFDVYFTLEDYVNLESNKDVIRSSDATGNIGEGTIMHTATKVQLGTVELYTVTVNWFATSSDTVCTISSAVETSSGLPNTDRDVLVGLNLVDAEAAPPSNVETKMVDCNGEDTEITGASIQAGSINLSEFNSLVLTAGGETANVAFNNDGTLDADGSQLPFRFSGSDLTVDGKALNNLLVQLVYDTTQGNTCKALN